MTQDNQAPLVYVCQRCRVIVSDPKWIEKRKVPTCLLGHPVGQQRLVASRKKHFFIGVGWSLAAWFAIGVVTITKPFGSTGVYWIAGVMAVMFVSFILTHLQQWNAWRYTDLDAIASNPLWEALGIFATLLAGIVASVVVFFASQRI